MRATLEGIAFAIAHIMDAVAEDKGIVMQNIKIDGGASKNDFLAQSMADFMGVPVEEVKCIMRYRPLAQLCMDNERMEPRYLIVDEKPAPGRESTPRRIARR